MRAADVVVIGGGCVGTSAQYHLAALGCTDTLLLEAGTLGCGSTSKAAGGIRLQYGDEANTRIAQRSLAEFLRFEEMTGAPIDFHQVGYLFLLDNDQDWAHFRAAAAVQNSLGVPTTLLTADDILARVPGLNVEDIVGGTFCELEGYAAPEAVVQGYARTSRRLGARIENGVAVTEIMTDADGVCGVRTADEVISTRQVVIAAGVDSPAIAATVGLDLPVTALPRTIFFSGQDAGVPQDCPLVVDFSTSFYFHREGPGLVFAGPQRDIADLSGPATHRLPAIADVSVQSSWWGNYEMSPDHNGIVGSAAVRGLYYATGFSGHGFMQSPAVGEHVAELVLGRPTTLDLSHMSAERFADGRHRIEKFVI